MTFTTISLFFGGLVAAGIPVVLHLLMRGKPKRIEFPALMFVKKRLEIHKRSYQLKHLILLALRVLAFILIGLALARPTLKLGDWFPTFASSSTSKSSLENRGFVETLATSLGSQDAPVAAAIVVDSSTRMKYVAENRTRLDVAKEFARWILAQLPEGSEIAVLSSERESPVFQVDVLAAGEKLERLQTVPTGGKVVETILDALGLLRQSEIQQRELYILSDLSEPGWSVELSDSLRSLIDEMKTDQGLFGASEKDLGIFVVDVGVENPTDSAIVRLSVSPQSATSQSTVYLETEFSHIGSATSRTVDVLLSSLSSDASEDTVRDTRTVVFPDGESRSRELFTLTGLEPGIRQGKIRFTVPDALTVDDQVFFTLRIGTPWKILLVARPPVRESSKYLREALDKSLFEVQTALPTDLSGKTLNELRQFKSVILLDPAPLEPSNWKKLSDYASSGGGVGVFLGPHAEPMDSFNDSVAVELLGAKLVRQARASTDGLWIVPGNGVSPILGPFLQEGDLSELPWDAQPVFRYWETSDLNPGADVALPYSDGRAAIIVQNIGRGRTVVVTTPVCEPPDSPRPWNLLPRSDVRWMFLLLSEGIARFLVGAAEQNFNFQAGQPIVVHPDWSGTQDAFPSTCLLGTPSGASVRLSPDVQRREISIPSTSEPGNYRIRSGGARESLDTGFSVNLAGQDMILRRIDERRLEQILGEKNFKLVRTPREIETGIARRRVGQELYTFFLVLLVFVFAAEYIFSNRFYKVEMNRPAED